MKHESCSAHNIWLAAGKPRSGQLFELKKNAHYKYTLVIKDAAVAFEQKFSDELMEYFFKKDMNTFWTCWRSNRNKSGPVTATVDGASDDGEIANNLSLLIF